MPKSIRTPNNDYSLTWNEPPSFLQFHANFPTKPKLVSAENLLKLTTSAIQSNYSLNLSNIVQTVKNLLLTTIHQTHKLEKPILTVAHTRAKEKGESYAFANSPTSPLLGLSGNKVPEITSLDWLQNKNKCNQFVGDVLTLSGYKMPTWTMPDGTLHYKHAESLAHDTTHFQKITRKSKIIPGDIVVIDYLKKSGENGAHVEFISSINFSNNSYSLLGAKKDGAYENTSSLSFHTEEAGQDGGWLDRDKNIYVLRPKLKN